MRLRALHLLNFRQHADTTVAFDLGLTGIVGPNGSGKSTLLEAIAWALYGTPAARGSRDTIRWLKAPPRATVRVELDFELGGHRYRVVRGLTSAEVYLDGGPSPIANSISGVSELLRQRLRMTRGEFFNTYFTGQKELAVMAAMGPTARGQFLSRVLGYERLRTAQELIHDQRRAFESEITGLKQGMADAQVVRHALNEAADRLRVAERELAAASGRRGRARTGLDALTPHWDAIQREREELQAFAAELRVAEGEEALLARDAARVERERADVAAAREALDGLRRELIPLASLRAQLAEQEALARDHGRWRALLDNERALADEVARLRHRLSELTATDPVAVIELRSALEQRRVALREAEVSLDAARADWVRDQQEAQTRIEQLRVQLRELREQREQLVEAGEEGTCPTCARPLHDHYRSVLDFLDGQIESVKVDGTWLKQRIEQLQQKPAEIGTLEERRIVAVDAVTTVDRLLAKADAQQREAAGHAADVATKEARLAEMRAEIAARPVHYVATHHEQLRGHVARLQPVEAQAQRLDALLEREAPLATEWSRVTEQLQEIRSRVARLSAHRSALERVEARFTDVRARFEGAAALFRDEEVAEVVAQGRLATAQAAVVSATDAARALDAALAQLETLTRNRRLHEELERAYGDMRTDLNRELRPEISTIASRYLEELTDGRYTELELDDAYNIVVLEDRIPRPVISGGEQDLANLVLRLAISEMIADRAGQPFSLLILDEIFGSLDKSRRDNVLDLLRRLHDRFEQVIVLSHVETIAEGLDNVIGVSYDDEAGRSSVEQVRALTLRADVGTEEVA